MLYVIRKNIFLYRHIFMKKVILNCLKTNLCVWGQEPTPLRTMGVVPHGKTRGPIIRSCQGWISQTHFPVIEHCKSVDSPQPWWDIRLKITPRDRSVEFWKDSSWRLTVKWFQKLCYVQFPSCRPWSGYWYINWKVNTSRRVLGATRRVIFMVGVNSSRYHVIYTKFSM